jgi:DNA-binding response OmpR family regulator
MTSERRGHTDGCRILLVEDNDELRRLMRLALEIEGYRVEAVRSAEDGLRSLERERFDLLLTDYTLPGETGAWLLRAASEQQLLRGGTALVVTAQPDAPEIGRDVAVIEKPVNFDEFLPQIRAILAQGSGRAVHRTGESSVMPRPTDAAVELVLYVSPHSLPCRRAVRVMRELLARYDEAQVRFAVRDISADPEHAAVDRILFTPTLIRRSPSPQVWVLGDLSRPEVVIDLLLMCGIEPVGQTH